MTAGSSKSIADDQHRIAPPNMTSEATRSGYVAANIVAMAAPSDIPNNAARDEPTASITARTSSIRSSSVGTPAMRSDIPTPRLSKRINREKDAKRRRYRATEGSSQKT